MNDHVITPVWWLLTSAMDCSSDWLGALLLVCVCVGMPLLVLKVMRRGRLLDWSHPGHSVWQLLLPVLLCVGFGLLPGGEGCLFRGPVQQLAEVDKPDTRCEYPEISGVALSRACRIGEGDLAFSTVPGIPVTARTVNVSGN